MLGHSFSHTVNWDILWARSFPLKFFSLDNSPTYHGTDWVQRPIVHPSNYVAKDRSLTDNIVHVPNKRAKENLSFASALIWHTKFRTLSIIFHSLIPFGWDFRFHLRSSPIFLVCLVALEKTSLGSWPKTSSLRVICLYHAKFCEMWIVTRSPEGLLSESKGCGMRDAMAKGKCTVGLCSGWLWTYQGWAVPLRGVLVGAVCSLWDSTWRSVSFSWKGCWPWE